MSEQKLVEAMIAMFERSAHELPDSAGFTNALAQNETLRKRFQSFPEPQRARLLAIIEAIRVLLQSGKDDVDDSAF